MLAPAVELNRHWQHPVARDYCRDQTNP